MKARAVTGLDPETPLGDNAEKLVRVRLDELSSFMPKATDPHEVVALHDMRVASRRLRAVLEIFAPCFPQGDYKTVLRDVKALADALGERRDPDVHIEAMEAFERDVQATNRPGIDALVARLRQRQARGNDALAGALEDARESDLQARLHSLCDGALEVVE